MYEYECMKTSQISVEGESSMKMWMLLFYFRLKLSPPFLSSPENDRPSSLVLEVIDYNMPLTTTYMKQMKLQCMSNNKVREVDGAACLTTETLHLILGSTVRLQVHILSEFMFLSVPSD